MLDQGTRCWGVVIPVGDHGAMRVERYADREHAVAVADASPRVRTRYTSPTTGTVKIGEVYPLVQSGDGCATWRYSATGWVVPIEARR